MHNLNVSLHESPPRKQKVREIAGTMIESETNIEHEDRLAKVLTLHSKGFPQSEIAKTLNVNQSTISRDQNEIRRRARKKFLMNFRFISLA